MDRLEEMFDYVDAHFDTMLGELKEVCSFRSVAGDEAGLEKTRQYILDKWKSIGLEAEEYPVEGGNSILYSSNCGQNDMCVLLYNHYDVVQEGNIESWRTKAPFNAQIVDGKLYAAKELL